MKIALVQTISCANIDTNLKHCHAFVSEAADTGADMLLLPENVLCYGCPPADVVARQEELKACFSAWAKQYGIWLVSGTLPWLDTGFSSKPSASCFVFNRHGEDVTHYRKAHLFDADVADATGAYRESDSYARGDKLGIFETPWGLFGIAICYDLRFPEYFRLLAEKGVKAVCIPSAFTYVTGEAHWEVLLRARAIENQMFVLAANQGGEHSATRKTWGESMIVSPWGSVLKKAALGQRIVTADINFSELEQIRKKMPVLQHRHF